RRQLFLRVLESLDEHQCGLLPWSELMAADTIILLYDPPAFLNITPIIEGPVLVCGGESTFLAAHQERGESLNLVFHQMHVWHAQLFQFRLDEARVPNIRLGQLVFEKSLVV